MDFPKFLDDEDDPGDWLSQVEQLFKYHNVDLDDRVIVAALILKDHARMWFKIFSENIENVNWRQFRRALISRFCQNESDNYFGDISNSLKHSCAMPMDYQQIS